MQKRNIQSVKKSTNKKLNKLFFSSDISDGGRGRRAASHLHLIVLAYASI